jgi:hypothetical protein
MVAQNNIFKAPVIPQNPAAADTNNGCKLEWGIYPSNEKSEVRFFTDDKISDNFSRSGRWFDRFLLLNK